MNITFSIEPKSNPVKRLTKGISLLKLIDDYVVVDLETTGLSPYWDDIIEIAAIKVEKGIVVDHFQSLVCPRCEISDFISNLTGITSEMVVDAPIISEILPSFIDFVGKSIVVAHNAHFDINFIYDNCIRKLQYDFTNDFIDTMRLSRHLFKEYNSHKLSCLVARFGISENVEHRALADAEQTYECYEHMKKYALENEINIVSTYYNFNKPVNARDIVSENTDFNEDTSIFGKIFVFTGELEKMTRGQAMQVVVDMGGICKDSVVKATDFLVLGNNDYCLSIKDGKSTKQKKAEQMKLAGSDIEIISENVFYDMLNE
jgi:DNA polymerase-3 subunit epsilon